MKLENNAVAYDSIGVNYGQYRQADDRLVETICQILPDTSDAPKVLDLGAGTGNYSVALAEKAYSVIALEPSSIMRAQAGMHPNVKWISATLEACFVQHEKVDAIIAIMVIQHLKPLEKAIEHCFRLCPKGPIIFFIWDPRHASPLWVADYFPQVWNQALQTMPSVENVSRLMQEKFQRNIAVKRFLIPADYQDSFVPANWSRPENYCDLNYLNATSGFALTDQTLLAKQIEKLKSDLENGNWHRRYAHLLNLESYDVGCRLLVG